MITDENFKEQMEKTLLAAPENSTVAITGYTPQSGPEFDIVVRLTGHDTYPKVLERQEAYLRDVIAWVDEEGSSTRADSKYLRTLAQALTEMPAEFTRQSIKFEAQAALNKLLKGKEDFATKQASGQVDDAKQKHPHVATSSKGKLLLRNVRVLSRATRGAPIPPRSCAELLQQSSPLTVEFCFQLALDPGNLLDVVLNGDVIYAKP